MHLRNRVPLLHKLRMQKKREMPQSFCEAVIALTPKPDKGNGKKKKYRAISCMKYMQKFNMSNQLNPAIHEKENNTAKVG